MLQPEMPRVWEKATIGTNEQQEMPRVWEKTEAEIKEQQEWERIHEDLRDIDGAKRRDNFFAAAIEKFRDTLGEGHAREVLQQDMNRAKTWAWAEYNGESVVIKDIRISEDRLIVEIDMIDCNHIAKRQIVL